MVECKTRIKEGVKANDKVKVLVIKEKDSLKVKDIFGTIKWKAKTDKLLKEIDKEFEGMGNVEFVK